MPCIFCGSVGKLSKEHVVPQWIGSAFPSSERGVLHRFAWVSGEPESDSPITGVDFDAPPFTWQARVVCVECNNGWMSSLEARVKDVLIPMMRGEPQTFDRDAQRLIALWATKTALVFLAHGRRREAPPAHFGQLYGGIDMPDNVDVWMARTHATEADVFSAVGGNMSGELFYCVLIAIEQLVLQVMGSSTGKVSRTISLAQSGVLRRLWPPENAVSWPPPSVLDHEALMGSKAAYLSGESELRAIGPSSLLHDRTSPPGS